MRPPSLHSAFFSSLKQVEKRLASENNNKPNKNPPQNLSSSSIPTTKVTTTSETDGLTSPIYLNYHQSNSPNIQDSDPPQEFLSDSIESPPSDDNDGDDIERLMDLLGYVSDCGEGRRDLKGNSCLCNGEFYSNVVGMKGPKCEKEMERLEKWIRFYSNDSGERREPLRLAHLLLAKAVYLDGDDCSFGGMEFPSTVEEFLKNDPPLPN
ncbi:uncharacterized protein LOC143846156 [Tasmannia lanceolata]|uniref:uncharacterized protein LOC143846156 n=1 Tax=Tasmannia lanceolata TaxID=3420 RepID=UPI004062B1A4